MQNKFWENITKKLSKKSSISRTALITTCVLVIVTALLVSTGYKTAKTTPTKTALDTKAVSTAGTLNKNKGNSLVQADNFPTEERVVELSTKKITQLIQKTDLSNPKKRAGLVQKLREIEKRKKQAFKLFLTKKNLTDTPMAGDTPEGGYWEIDGRDPNTGQVRIRITHNENAAITSNAKGLDSTQQLNGSNITVGVWDAGSIRTTHVEFSNQRITIKDGSTMQSHPTQVAGSIGASGVKPTAKGMAPSVKIDSYDWTSDIVELTENAAASPSETNKIPISNHSYSYTAGWYKSSGTYIYLGNTEFGKYNYEASEADALAYAAPYYLMVRSAGNDRLDNPTNGAVIKLDYWATITTNYNASIHPAGDGVQKSGYDTIAYEATAKNVLTIGAVNDGVTSGSRDISKSTMTSYSSWGPTDDGRIKPDLVANGSSLYTTTSTSNNSYASFSGTSASAPIATGIAALVTQKFIAGTTSKAMLSSTLKAVLIHSADDLGLAGPDYQNGWGLINASKAVDLINTYKTNSTKKSIQEVVLSNSSVSQTFTYDGSGPIRATLCWIDPAGDENPSSDSPTPALVHNLDIKIVDQKGNTYYPYTMGYSTLRTTQSASTPASTGTNNVDNVEVIDIQNPQAGQYTVKVSYQGTLTTSQTYSLVLSGISSTSNPSPNELYNNWAIENFGSNWGNITNTSQTDDFDNDGLNNWSEFNLGTVPTSNQSKLKLEMVGVQPDPTLEGAFIVTLKVSPLTDSGTIEIWSKSDLSNPNWDGPKQTAPSIKATEKLIYFQTSSPSLFFKATYVSP